MQANSQSVPHSSAPLKGTTRPLTREDHEIRESGFKANENTIAALDKYLEHLVTITSALIGGVFVFGKDGILPYWFAVGMLTTAVASLGWALHGLRPTKGREFRPQEINAYDRYKNWVGQIAVKKAFAVQVASWGLVVAFAIGVSGMILKGAMAETTPPSVINPAE